MLLGCVSVGVESPIGNPAPTRGLSGHDAGSRGRTDRTGAVGIGEEQAAVGQCLHCRGSVPGIEACGLRAELDGGVLPSEVVHQKQDDVGGISRTGHG